MSFWKAEVFKIRNCGKGCKLKYKDKVMKMFTWNLWKLHNDLDFIISKWVFFFLEYACQMSCLFQWFVIYILWLETFCTTHSNKCFAFCFLLSFNQHRCHTGRLRWFIPGDLPVCREIGDNELSALLKEVSWIVWWAPEANECFSLKCTQTQCSRKVLSSLINSTACKEKQREELE